MLIRHDQIYLDAGGETTDGLLVRNGAIRATGDRAAELRESGERVVEPEAKCLFPGLTDAHCHLWGLGRRAGSVDVSETDSRGEVLERLRDVSVDELPAGWVLGRGWDENRWSDPARDWRTDLDDLFPETPVCLHRVDRHAVAVNGEALRRAGIDRDSEATSGGRIARDDEGRATGLLIDDAMDRILDAVPDPDVEEDRRMFREAAERYLEYGVTCAHIARARVDRIRMVQSLHEHGELPLRLYVLAGGRDEDLPEFLAEGPRYGPDAEFACRGVKFFADGALGSRGALLMGEYADGSGGLPVTGADELRRRAKELLESGWQVAVHAIGDRANRNVLDAYEAASPEARDELRPRVEHAQMVTEADRKRFGDLSTVASIQPIHMYSDAAWADEALDTDQLDRLFPWCSLRRQTTLAAGSDFPIEDPNPWHGLATAVSRRAADGGVFRPDQALERSEALGAYTTGPAYAAHWEGRLGRLRPGYAADVIALDRDPFDASADELWETEVLATWLGGERR